MPEQASQRVTEGTSLGRYTILELLGAGGMGVVYRARDERLERVVAIKVLTPGVLVGEDARKQFRKEALALAKLNHAHIAAVYDVGEQDGVDYLVMELVQGESLAAKIKAGTMSVKEATSILLQVAEALDEAHERGVIHRDLKPANVMVTPKGSAKVLDFGLAKLFAGEMDATVSFAETKGMAGTPLYMSPEQINGGVVDARTDLWSLGVMYYEALAGRTPFEGANTLTVLRAIVERPVEPVVKLRPEVPAEAGEILTRLLQKDPAKRYQTAAEVVGDASALLLRMSGPVTVAEPKQRVLPIAMAVLVPMFVVVFAGLFWQYHRYSQRQWVREEGIPQMASLREAKKPLAAFLVLEKAEKILPKDEQLKEIAAANTIEASVTSEPAGAEVAIQDYMTPNGEWLTLGVTPLKHVRLPKGYFRWKVTKQGYDDAVSADYVETENGFQLSKGEGVTAGMVQAPGGTVEDYEGFIGWIGPYEIPPYWIDKYEVSNREYQKFVDGGGYAKREYWPAFTEGGHTLTWDEAMAKFRDTSGRPGPATWAGGHYPEGQGDFPVSGVSWYEATAYATAMGKSLPVLAQRYDAAPPHVEQYVVAASNIAGTGLAKVGAFQGVGPYGTYDMAGNVREWVENAADNDLRFILGGSWQSPLYMYTSPEALSPFDRSATNGFRCVLNSKALPAAAVGQVRRLSRDFAGFKPVSDEVFNAFKLLYAYPDDLPLNAKVEGTVKETVDWTEVKVTLDAAYNGERFAAYLFLPKNVKPPYQTVLFFPSARVEFLPPDSSELGDVKFFDYILQSGRAVMYPVYEDTYERRTRHSQAGGGQDVNLTQDWYKDAARSLDYLATRKDIDSGKLAYMGVSMGAADGVILSSLLQERLKTAILLDGGYFMQKPPAGGDQAEFAVRMKKSVLMVNGKYDYTFPVELAQDPLFKMLGTPAAEKKHVLLDTPHDVTEDREHLKAAVLDWLDQYLGRVN